MLLGKGQEGGIAEHYATVLCSLLEKIQRKWFMTFVVVFVLGWGEFLGFCLLLKISVYLPAGC